MTLRLYSTLTRRLEPVTPLAAGRVTMYSCGPTVYRYAHIGNLRTFLLPDLIRRVLLYHGLDVVHVQNITDVGHLRDERFDRGEDRMLVAAGLEKRTPAEIAAAYEAAFHADAAAINLLPAHVYPRATEHIAEMLALAERLEDLGNAYATDLGNVYYAVASYPAYGRLSGNTLDRLREGHRGVVEADKRDPADFALWKAAGPGRILKWPTRRWGDGSPGWHLECSAMAMRHLGERFDIHTGGADNVFPHHEDEIAQSAPLVGGPPATIWAHGAFLTLGGRKMAKSAGNFERITEIADRGLDPLAFRYLCLTSRHARPLAYSATSLAGAAAGLQSLRSRLRALGPAPTEGPWTAPPVIRAGRAPDRPVGRADGIAGHGEAQPEATAHFAAPAPPDRAHAPAAPLSEAGRRLHERFVEAIDDDLDLPTALAVVREAVRADLAADERRWLVLDADAILGLDLDRVWQPGTDAVTPEIPAEIEALVADRGAARADRDFARADAVRADLLDRGYEVVDGPVETSVRRREGA